MSSAPNTPTAQHAPPTPRWSPLRPVAALGAQANQVIRYLGGITTLALLALAWTWRSLALRRVRFGAAAFQSQVVRVGVRSMSVIALVSFCIGAILALQMAPPLAEFNQTDKVATIIAIAVVRELGPLISAIVLTGFAGASIAAEIGTMVVGEEVEALEAHALNPVRFLVMPRLLATTLALVVLCAFTQFVAIGAGMAVGVGLLDVPRAVYWANTLNALDVADFATGLFKAAVFGAIIASIACHNGLAVSGGASGVGKATTHTVVHAIVSIIVTDLVFTAVFYRLGWT
jgi:phospholipid/cholesterol/gamma-HCH transport system permease protein